MNFKNIVRVSSALLFSAFSTFATADFDYRVYDGSFNQLPNFNNLNPIAAGQSPTITRAVTNQQDNFALVFTQEVTITRAGEYEFSATSDDGSKIVINNNVVVDNDGLHGAQIITNSIFLNEGKHDFRVEYFEATGGEYLEITYRTENAFYEPIPANGVLEYKLPPLKKDTGEWGEVIAWPHIAISAGNLPDGRVVTWSSTETNAFPSNRQFTHAAIFDPADNSFRDVNNNFHDMFCAGVSTLEDGTIVASGGNPDDNRTTKFDPNTLNWSPLANMFDRRWYATNLTLGNNQIFTGFGKSSGNRSEKYDPDANRWIRTPNANMQTLLNEHNANINAGGSMEWFPQYALEPNGRVFHGGPTPTLHSFDPTEGTANDDLGRPTGNRTRKWGNIVTYDVGKVMMLGGADFTRNDRVLTTNVFLTDLNGPTPVVTQGPPMNFPRALSNSVTLPNGEIIVIGGNTSAENFSDAGSILPAEIYNPQSNSWTIVDSITIPRNYHSTALLLKDGRVLSAGGGACGNGCGANHLDGQIFTPPYLFNDDGSLATRPVINEAPARTGAGVTFTVKATADTQRFTMVRLSATTHHVNTDQRFIPVTTVANGDGTFKLSMNPNPNVLIAGNYWLYAVNADGTPSVGETIQVISDLSVLVDTDGDGVFDNDDAFPNDPTETKDSDGDGVGDNADFYPNDPTRTQEGEEGSGIVREWWLGIGGANDVGSLTNLAEYPNNPTGIEAVDFFEGPTNWNDTYGSRLSGVLYAPTTGNYTFWVAGDDNVELWLSTNEAQANQRLIAEVPGWTDSRQWNKFAQQRSATIRLEEGQGYYIAALHKEGNGGDNLAVAWQQPDDNVITVLDRRYFVVPGPVDTDGDGVIDEEDAFPNDPTETQDTDGDGVGDNGDAFPNDATETKDTDGDGVGDNADDFPNDPTRTEFSDITALPESPRNSSTLIVETSSGADRIWNVNPDNHSVSVSSTNGTLIEEISVGDKPWSLAKSTSANKIYITNKGAATISIVNAQTFAVEQTVDLPVNSQPHGIVFDSTGTHYYVVLEASAVLEKRLVANNSLVAELPLSGTPRHISIKFDDSQVYVSNFITPLLGGESTTTVDITDGQAEVFLIDTATFVLEKKVGLSHNERVFSESQGSGMPNYLSAPVVSFDDAYAYVPAKKDNVSSGTLRGKFGMTFDTTVRANTWRIDLSSTAEDNNFNVDHDNSSVATHAALSGDNRYLFVALETSRELAVYDTQNGAQLMRLPTGRAPQAVALSTDGSKAYVHNFMDRSVSRFDLSEMLKTDLPATNLLPAINVVTNEALEAEILLGKQHFYDAADDRLAKDNYMSCAACHKEGKHDGRVWDFAAFGEGVRNTTSLLGKGGKEGLFHWSGNFDEAQDFEAQIRAFAGGTGLMSDADFNSGTVDQPLGEAKAGKSADLDALAAYIESLTLSVLSPVREGEGLTDVAKQGFQLFDDKGCATCHSGTDFSDSDKGERHDIGTLTAASGSRLSQVIDGFDTPSLLGLWTSAPYLHDGSAATVEQAILAHSNISVTEAEAAEITRFLHELPSADALDTDGDGVPDIIDAFPNDPTETKDSDGDGVGDNADVFPNDPTETKDTDNDGIGDNADVTPNGEAPSVLITSPAANAAFTQGDTIAITADASDTDGTIESVSFYSGDTLIATDATAPYAVNWDDIPAGTLNIKVVALDNLGEKSESTVQVIAEAIVIPNVAPTITLTAPTIIQTYTVGDVVSIAANAADSDGTVASVAFYNGNVLLNTDTTAPYAYDWAGAAEGGHLISAVATDNEGAQTSSNSVQINVQAPVVEAINLAPVATLATSNVSPWENLNAVNNQTVHTSSRDKNGGAYGNWRGGAAYGDTDWVSFTWGAVKEIEAVDVYWWDDGYGIETPNTANVEYWTGNAWVELNTIGVQSNQYNRIEFDGITTTSIRVSMSSTKSTGILETRVWGREGVIVIPNQAPTVELTAPAANASYTAGDVIAITANAADSDGSVSSVAFYNGANLLASDTTAPYAFALENAAAGSYVISARATDNDGAVTTSDAVSVTVEAIVIPNLAPTIELTAPTENASYTAGDVIAITANAADSDGSVTNVAFYNGANLLGSDTTVPYAFTLENAAAGSYVISARATDNDGAVTTSDAVSVTVEAIVIPNVAPTIELTAPAANASYTAGDVIAITANAADSDGSVTSVAFYNGSNLLGADTTAPYAFALENAAAGSYVVSARATDNDGEVTTSEAVTVTVEAIVIPNVAPRVELTAPTANVQYIIGDAITIAANATDSDGSVTSVAFYNGEELLNTDTTAPYTYNWTSAAEGVHSITAVATDNEGEASTSAAVQVTVEEEPIVSAINLAPSATLDTSYVSPWENVTAVNNETTHTSSRDKNGGAYGNWRGRLAYGETDWVSFSWASTKTIEAVEVYWWADGRGVFAPSTANVEYWNGDAWLELNNIGIQQDQFNRIELGSVVTTSIRISMSGVRATGILEANIWGREGGVVITPNVAPTVSVNTPTNNAVYELGETISLAATAADSDGSVTSVSFYVGGTLFGTDSTAPYSFDWNNAALGNHTITALALDDDNAETTSSEISIRVVDDSTPAEPVSINIINHSFEDVQLGNGGIGDMSAGWTGGSGVFNPSTRWYDSLATDQNTGTMTGSNSAFFYGAAQPLQQTVGTVTSGLTYTLTVALGGRTSGENHMGASLELLADGQVVAANTIATAPLTDTFADISVDWLAPASYAGSALSIRISTITNNGYTDVDNVRLTSVVGSTENPDTNNGPVSADCSAKRDQAGSDIVLLMGQSNMSGWGQGYSAVIDGPNNPRIKQWARNNTIKIASEHLEHADYGTGYPGVGMGTAFGRAYVATLPAQRDVLLVPTAYGGTALVNGPWSVGGNLYEDAITRMQAALASNSGNCVAAILWHQGEADAINGVSQAAYISTFTTMLTTLRNRIPAAAKSPFILGEFTPTWISQNQQATAPILNAIRSIPNSIDYTAVASSATVTTTNSGDIIHFDAFAMRQYGKIYFDSLSSALANNND